MHPSKSIDSPAVPSTRDIDVLLEHAIEIADESRAITNRLLTTELVARVKSDSSFVTDLDLAIEDAARARLEKRYPHSAILGEERSPQEGNDDLAWIIDPIDGTHSLRQRLPLFGTVLACLYRGTPVVGLIDLHALDQRYCAARGRGTTRNGEPVYITDLAEGSSELESEIIAIGDRRQFIASGRLSWFDSLLTSQLVVRIYPDCFGHSLAISGAAGAMLDPDLKPWDVAATQILVEEAGGRYVELASHPSSESNPHQRYDVLFGKPSVVDWIERFLEELSQPD